MSEIISPVIEELAERAMAFTGGREGYYPTPIDGLSFTVHAKRAAPARVRCMSLRLR